MPHGHCRSQGKSRSLGCARGNDSRAIRSRNVGFIVMEIVIIVAGLVVALIVVWGRLKQARFDEAALKRMADEILEQEKRSAEIEKKRIEALDPVSVVDELSGHGRMHKENGV